MTQALEVETSAETVPEAPGAGTPVLRVHLWLETEAGVFFGLGRLQLLKAIRSGLSLKAAADRMGMSYRAAWGKIKRTEAVLGTSLIEKRGGNRSGYRLTPAGELLMDRFEIWYAEVERFALERGRALLPCRPVGYDEAPAQQGFPPRRKA